MAVFLFDDIIFGPVKSRRLGVSLGINLLPVNAKVCNFNCIYCECGWTDNEINNINLPSRETIKKHLALKLSQMKQNNEPLDVITFAGNGEPTIHPDFCGIIDDTIELRNMYFPNRSIAVLSNATMLDNLPILNTLQKIEQNILKLDSAFEKTIRILNQPPTSFSLERLLENLKKFAGNFILQTLFIKGLYKGTYIDNSTEEEVIAWLKIVDILHPTQVMVYTISRDTPTENLEKISLTRLNEIAQKVNELGIKVQVSG